MPINPLVQQAGNLQHTICIIQGIANRLYFWELPILELLSGLASILLQEDPLPCPRRGCIYLTC